MATALETFDSWKAFLADRVNQAQETGMGQELIANLAFQIGEFLENKVDPKNGEQRLLQQLWQVGTEEERHALASLMVKMVDEK